MIPSFSDIIIMEAKVILLIKCLLLFINYFIIYCKLHFFHRQDPVDMDSDLTGQ